MLWIDIHTSLRGHPKVKRLAEKLGVHRAHALGLLVDIWLWAICYAPHGDLSTFSAADISEAADWDGKPELMDTALKASGWIDLDGKLHDWEEHRLHFNAFQESQDRRREKTRDRVARWRERQKEGHGGNESGNDQCDAGVTRTKLLRNAPTRNTRKTGKTEYTPHTPQGGQGGDGPSAGKGGGAGGTVLAKAIAEVSDGFTIILDQNIGDENWKTVYGRSIGRHARKLVTLFGGDSGKALDCIEGIVKHAKARGWTDWTPKTVVDRAGDWAAGRLGRR